MVKGTLQSLATTPGTKFGTAAVQTKVCLSSGRTVAVWLAGQVVITGGVVSTTVNVVEQFPTLPAVSATVTEMGCVPNPTIVPAAGLCVVTREPEDVQLSVATTSGRMFGMDAWQLALAEALVPAGQVTTGFSVSLTVSVKLHEVLRPLASVTS